MAFQIRRGTNSERQGITPSEGELIYTTDTKKLFVGDGTSAGGNPVEYFSKIRVNAVDVVPDNVNLGTITLAAGTGITLAADIITDTITINSTTAQAESFKTISISGQSNIVADTNTDTLTLVAGSNITLTTDPTTDSITIASTSNYFSTIAVAGNSNVVADSATDTLTLVAGSNITLTTDPTTDSITIASTSNYFSTIAVAGNSNIVADSSTDTLTLIAGTGITINTDSLLDSITINGANSFSTIAVTGQNNVVAETNSSQLRFVAGNNVNITTDDITDSITFSLPSTLYSNIIGNTTGYHSGDVKGSLFSDDSTLLIDAIHGKIRADVDNFNITSKNFVGSQITLRDSILGRAGILIETEGSDDDPYDYLTINGYSNTTRAPAVIYKRFRGTISSPAPLQAGDALLGHYWIGADANSNGQVAAAMHVEVDGAPASGACPGKIIFYTADNLGNFNASLSLNKNGVLGILDNSLTVGGGSGQVNTAGTIKYIKINVGGTDYALPLYPLNP